MLDFIIHLIFCRKLVNSFTNSDDFKRESGSLLLNTCLQLLQNMGANKVHSEFLNFVRNVSLEWSAK